MTSEDIFIRDLQSYLTEFNLSNYDKWKIGELLYEYKAREMEYQPSKVQFVEKKIYINITPKEDMPIPTDSIKIMELGAEYFNVSISTLTSKNRTKALVQKRQLIQYYMHEKNYRLIDIAKAFKQDHTTIIHVKKKISNELSIYNDVSEKYLNMVEFIEGKLNLEN